MDINNSVDTPQVIFRNHIMECCFTMGRLLGVRSLVTYRASVLVQRLLRLVDDVESSPDRKGATVEELQSALAEVPSVSVPPLLRDVSQYSDVYHRIASFLSCSDESWLYIVAAAFLIVCKLDCPSVRIRVVLFALERIMSRRRAKVLEQPYHTMIVSPAVTNGTAPTTTKNHTHLPPHVYDGLKEQVVRAEMTLLLALGFRVVVDLPQKYILLFLRFVLLPDEATPTATSTGTPSSDPQQQPSKDLVLRKELMNDWAMDACHWANALVHSTYVETYDAAVLAAVAIELNKPHDISVREGAVFQRAKVTDLPSDWMTVFGIPREEVVEARGAINRNITTVRSREMTVARLRQELNKRITALLPPPPPPPPPPLSSIPDASFAKEKEAEFVFQLNDIQNVLAMDKKQKQREKAERQRLEKEAEERRAQEEAAAKEARRAEAAAKDARRAARREASRERTTKKRDRSPTEHEAPNIVTMDQAIAVEQLLMQQQHQPYFHVQTEEGIHKNTRKEKDDRRRSRSRSRRRRSSSRRKDSGKRRRSDSRDRRHGRRDRSDEDRKDHRSHRRDDDRSHHSNSSSRRHREDEGGSSSHHNGSSRDDRHHSSSRRDEGRSRHDDRHHQQRHSRR